MIEHSQWKILHSEASRGWGGQERRILLEMQAMRKRGAQVTLACHPQSRIYQEAIGQNFVVHPLEMTPPFSPSTFLRVWRYLKKERFDLVHTHSSADSWAVGLATRAMGKSRPRVVRTRHLSTAVRGALVYTHLANRIITTGSTIRQYLIERGVSSEKVVSIPTGVDLDQFQLAGSGGKAFRQELGVGDQTPLIGNIAVLRSWKGHEDFLEVAKRVHAVLPHVRFVIVGDGPQETNLRERVQRENLEAFVHLTGYREDIPQILSALDIFLFCSYANEGVPQAVAQAMAMARPVVTTRVGSIEDLVSDGKTGLLTEPRDPEAMTEKVLTLLRDSVLRQRLGQGAHTHAVSDFSLARMEDALMLVYEDLLGPLHEDALAPKLKVALIRQRVSPLGGAESIVHRLAATMARLGHEVHIVAADWDHALTGITYHRIEISHASSWIRPLVFQRRVQDFLRQHPFDIVHGFDKTFPVDVYRAGDGSHRVWLRQAAYGRSPIFRFLIACNPKHWVLLWLEHRLFRNVSVVIANSQMVRAELLERYSLNPERVVTIPNGIDRSTCKSPVSREDRVQKKVAMDLRGDATVLLFIGSNYHRKGLIYALKAVADHKGRNLILLVAGKGREKAYRRFVNEKGIQRNVRFLGHVKDPVPLYQAADCMVLPTLYDPFSNVCLEAMAYGMPVITSPFNGAKEIIEEGNTGWIVSPERTSDALGKALKADLWRMGREAMARSEAYGFEGMCEGIVKSYLSYCKVDKYTQSKPVAAGN
jgi:glycosyltransferase involved in cell wall biosynthesis